MSRKTDRQTGRQTDRLTDRSSWPELSLHPRSAEDNIAPGLEEHLGETELRQWIGEVNPFRTGLSVRIVVPSARPRGR